MGHVRNYTIGDILSRYQQLLGKKEQPIGWDSFGLPAENAARKHKSHPNTLTRQNIQSMGTALKQLGFAYAWDREFATCDPSYYRWQQWLFLQTQARFGLQKDAWVNWDPVDQTVLASEQVINAEVGVRMPWLSVKISQWFCRISDYADRLLGDLDGLDQYRGG